MPLTFSDIMKNDLDVITTFDKWKNITVIFKSDTAVVSNYGEKTKTVLKIDTKANLNESIENTKGWEGDGFVPGGSLLCQIWRLESGGVDYMTWEYFTNNRIDNILILIGDIYYRITGVQAPETIEGGIPYMVFALTKQEEVPS